MCLVLLYFQVVEYIFKGFVWDFVRFVFLRSEGGEDFLRVQFEFRMFTFERKNVRKFAIV